MVSSSPQLIIDLDALRKNYRILCEKSGTAVTASVIKANGYGLGIVEIANALHIAGCGVFFTAHFSEALQVRATLPDVVIAPLHGLNRSEYNDAVEARITPVLNSYADIEGWAAYSKARELRLSAMVHLDTGMNRLGLSGEEQDRLASTPDLLELIDVTVWMSHLACSEEFENPMTTQQRDRFIKATEKLPRSRRSLCNSSGIFWGDTYRFDLVRAGIALYGSNPVSFAPNPMHPIFAIKAPILQIRNVDSPMTVGYGAIHRVNRKSRIATLALGYADGYPRSLSSVGEVKIGDRLAPIIGRISMDLITVDVTDLPETLAHVGQEAVVLGAHRSLDRLAQEAQTIPYEILTRLGQRFERHYIG